MRFLRNKTCRNYKFSWNSWGVIGKRKVMVSPEWMWSLHLKNAAVMDSCWETLPYMPYSHPFQYSRFLVLLRRVFAPCIGSEGNVRCSFGFKYYIDVCVFRDCFVSIYCSIYFTVTVSIFKLSLFQYGYIAEFYRL